MLAERSRDLEVGIEKGGPVDPLMEANGTKRVALRERLEKQRLGVELFCRLALRH